MRRYKNLNNILSLCALFSFFLIGICGNGYSQSKSRSRSAYDNPSKSAYDDTSKGKSTISKSRVPAADTTELPDNSGYNNKDSTGSNQGTLMNLPIQVIKDSSDDAGLFGTAKSSQRRDNILADDASDSTATPLPYTDLYSSDALYRVRVWRVIDARDKTNLPYFYNSSVDGEENTRLINVIMNAIQKDSVQAFSSIDDRFTTPISFQQAMATFGGGTDTSASYDLNGNIIGYQVRQKSISADSIFKYRIKEEWVFNKRDGKTYVRILGIAPLLNYTMSTGEIMDGSEHAAFWVYYPDLRTSLVRTLIPNPLNAGGRLTWEEVFENRLFSSTIIKSTLDAENGITKWPLTPQQAKMTQNELNNLSQQMWLKPSSKN